MSRSVGAFRPFAFAFLLIAIEVSLMDKTVPAGAAMLLDFIGGIEAPKGYGTIYGNKQHRLSKPLTEMTLAEVQAAQSAWSKNHGSSAAGRYQFMRATLKGLIDELGLSTSQKLDPDLQDRLGYHLLKRRGYDQFVAGKISTVEFGRRLAQEWASLPVLAATKGGSRKVSRGQSYYAGDGLNKSLTSPEQVETVLATVRQAQKPVPAPQVPETPKEPPAATKPALPLEPGTVVVIIPSKPKPAETKNRFVAWLLDIITAIFWPERK